MITIIDYGVGNIGSVANALSKLGKKFQISGNPMKLKTSDMLILPGVGAAGEGMQNLKKRDLVKVLVEEIAKGKKFLGICLGMQLLFDYSEEADTKCLGVLKGKVIKYKKEKKIPQIGWNEVNMIKTNFGMNNGYFYFVNSYYCIPKDKSIITGETTYGEKFASIIVKENIIATQFHPERSGEIGFQLLKNIIERKI